MWLLPTRRRLDKLKKFFDAAKATEMVTPGALIVHGEEFAELREEYNALLPANWSILTVPEDGGAAYKCQYIWDSYPGLFDQGWVGFVSDDCVPETSNWDVTLVAQLSGWNMISSNDGWQAPKRITCAIVWSVQLLNAIGYLAPPGLQHLFWDDELEVIGRATSCWSVDMNVMVRHKNAALEVKPTDSTSEAQTRMWEPDARVFDQWRMTERDAAIERVLKLMRSMGVEMMDLDLTDVSLLIASPNGGWFHRTYLKSMLQTFMALKQYGAHVDFFDHPGSSDLPMARAALFSAFYRSSFTHMLQIDDDMGFNFLDIVRMLKLKRDCIAVAGPAKSEQPRFAYANMDEYGRKLPLTGEPENSVLEVTHVGGAFVLITKACAERMVGAYRDELMFYNANRQECFDLYLPFVENKRHIAEDFAFCHRWRKIGGKVYVLSSATLQHSGDKTWSGRLDQHMAEKLAEAHADEELGNAAE